MWRVEIPEELGRRLAESYPQLRAAYYRFFFLIGNNYRATAKPSSDLGKHWDTVGKKCVRVGKVCVLTWGFAERWVGKKCVDNFSSTVVIHSCVWMWSARYARAKRSPAHAAHRVGKVCVRAVQAS